jgi:hypothetical protein
MARERFGASTFHFGGRRAGGAPARRAAAAGAAAALLAWAGCATPRAPSVSPLEVRAQIDAGLGLYESGEFALAAQRFREAADAAAKIGARATSRGAVTAECAAWMRARRLDELSECTLRLEGLQRRESRADPGVNTLLALGAIAGQRPLPGFRVPQAVHPIVRAAALEER